MDKPADIGPVFAQIHDVNLSGHLAKRYDSLYDLMNELERFRGLWHDYTGDGDAILDSPEAWVFLSDPTYTDPYPEYTVSLNDEGEALFSIA